MPNIQPESDGAMVYWRVKEALDADPFASMLAEPVRKGVAELCRRMFTTPDNRVKKYLSSRNNVMLNIDHALDDAPIAFFGEKPMRHIAEVCAYALLPDETEV